MAGDLDLRPTLKGSCIKTIAGRIDLFIGKYNRKRPATSIPMNFCKTDFGVSGSAMTTDTALSGNNEESMDCDDSSCLAALEIDSQKMAGHKHMRSVPTAKIFKNIEMLEMKCHHEPPCGTKKSPNSKMSVIESQQKVFIPNPISEELLEAVCKNGQLDDRAAEWFSDPTRFRIRKAYLKKAGHLTTSGLKALFSKHVLTEIQAQNISGIRQNSSPKKLVFDKKQITVGDIVSSMNSATKEKLQVLNVSGVRTVRDDLRPLAIYVSGGQFKKLSVLVNIRSLNVSYTNFTDNDLNTVIACMKNLKCLDISKTCVRSILYLGDMHAPKLQSLSMNNLDKLNMPKESLFDVFCKMTELRYLDISTEYKPQMRSTPTSDHQSINTAISMVMVGGGHPLKNLISLDISGRDGIEEVVFLNFYANHPQLVFIGLLHTSLDGLSCFADEKSSTFSPYVKVTGDRTEAQIKESLIRYYRRPFFAKEALYSLFNLTQLVPQYDKEQLELVLRCMRSHRVQDDISYSVQLAASACVYNLTHQESGLRMQTGVLSLVVKETLDTMEQFNDKKQLQKNCLMTLCNDRILKDVPFDYFKTAQLVMRCLCSCEDAAMHRMAVAIISILAAKISTEQTSVLGSTTNMKVLLQIVERKLEEHSLDLILKFTLSALWNLTDESPSTCHNFIVNGGLALIEKVLSAHEDSPCVQTKVLGLLNNLAEVPGLRHYLLEHDIVLINTVRLLLRSQHIEVCYFAAGVISHLAMLNKEEWDEMLPEQGLREVCLDDLYTCVRSWKPPHGEMVAYRTFKPFFPLLRRHDTPAMQLWAAWAIRHVCLKNGAKYQEMLIVEKGVDCLLEIYANPALDKNVRDLVQHTLKFIKETHPDLEMLAGV